MTAYPTAHGPLFIGQSFSPHRYQSCCHSQLVASSLKSVMIEVCYETGAFQVFSQFTRDMEV